MEGEGILAVVLGEVDLFKPPERGGGGDPQHPCDAEFILNDVEAAEAFKAHAGTEDGATFIADLVVGEIEGGQLLAEGVGDKVRDAFRLELVICNGEALELGEIFAQTEEVEALIAKEVVVEGEALEALETLKLKECFCARSCKMILREVEFVELERPRRFGEQAHPLFADLVVGEVEVFEEGGVALKKRSSTSPLELAACEMEALQGYLGERRGEELAGFDAKGVCGEREVLKAQSRASVGKGMKAERGEVILGEREV